jgi:hypothetical protein
MSQSLASLERRRSDIVQQIAALGDLRSGSISSTSGRCGKSNCHCHQPGQPGHGPHQRLTYKRQGKTVTESLPTAAGLRKAEREIATFRKFEQLRRQLLDTNAQICQLRPAEEPTSATQEKKRRMQSSNNSRGSSPSS